MPLFPDHGLTGTKGCQTLVRMSSTLPIAASD